METEDDWAARAAELLPTGASTGSKRPEALYGTSEPAGPTHFVRAAGCRVETTDGSELVDCTMALGAVAIGYGLGPYMAHVQHALGGIGRVVLSWRSSWSSSWSRGARS